MNTDAEVVQARLDRIGRLLPLPLLTVAILLAWLLERTGFGTPAQFRAALAVSAAAAAWGVLVGASAGRRGLSWRVCVFLGHLALSAVLVALNPWFALVALVGYMLADELPRPLAAVGMLATALVIAASEAGGYPFLTGASWIAYLLVAAVNAVLVLGVTGGINLMAEQNRQRGRMIAELNETNERLQSALRENAGLHAQLLEQAREAGVQDVRTRLAGEIHDTLAQTLTGIVTQLAAADRAVDGERQRHLEQARSLAGLGLREARRSVGALRPEQLERADLCAAIAELARDCTRTTGLPVAVESTGTVRALPAEVEDAVFRVAQEALTNVTRHAGARHAWLTLTYLADVVLLDVRDDGAGWSGEPRRGGFGLAGMRARLHRVGGVLQIESSIGDGTALSASVRA